MTATRRGATTEEWKAFIGLGLTEDLLPIISDKSLQLSPRSTMKSFGKVPTTLNAAGQVVGLVNWTTKRSTAREVSKWMGNEAHGICLNTRRIRAIDIDLDDPELARQVVDTVEMVLGPLPLRTRSTSGKRLLLIDMPGEFPKRVIHVGQEKIEFLGTGQQCVVAGIHTSGVPYEWPRGLPTEIPEVSPPEFEALWSALASVFGTGTSSIEVAGARPVKARSSDDIDDPVVAYLEDNNLVTGYGGDGKVFVRCPWAHFHSEEGDPSATTWLPAGVGGINKGHFKCLHTSHGRKTDDAFLAEIGFTASEFEEVRNGEHAEVGLAPIEDWPAFKRDRQDRIESTMDNAVKALSRPDICGVQLGYDEFKDALVIGREGLWRPIRDTDLSALRIELERRGFKAPGAELVRAAVDLVCERNAFDSAIQWARGLVWDGVPRVERFFVDHFSVRDTRYARAMGRYLWSALAGRAVCPGVKVDMVPVLISEQGTSKTSMIEALAPEEGAFVELNLEHRDDNLARSLRGKLVAEWAEMRGLRTRDAEAIKAWVTRRHEEWIPKFKEFSTRFPRRVVVIGTGNEDEILDDPTGERRWLPLKVGAVALGAIRAARDQLWAEGVALFDKHGVAWREAQELATAEHAAFKVGDAWDEVIGQWLETDAMDGPDGPKRGDEPFSLHAVAVGALGLDVRNIARKDELRIGKALRKLGFEKRDVKMGYQVLKRWFHAENSKNANVLDNADFV